MKIKRKTISMDTTLPSTDDQELSELDQAAQEAYERAEADGLCANGAMEIALDVMRQRNEKAVSDKIKSSSKD
jgi:L-aminopeptidase/D-esterase-like protein